MNILQCNTARDIGRDPLLDGSSACTRLMRLRQREGWAVRSNRYRWAVDVEYLAGLRGGLVGLICGGGDRCVSEHAA